MTFILASVKLCGNSYEALGPTLKLRHRAAMKEAPITYEIRVEGLIDTTWSDWFNGMTISHEKETETILLGKLPDQTALHGVLDRIRDLGLGLISVNRVNGDPPNPLDDQA